MVTIDKLIDLHKKLREIESFFEEQRANNLAEYKNLTDEYTINKFIFPLALNRFHLELSLVLASDAIYSCFGREFMHAKPNGSFRSDYHRTVYCLINKLCYKTPEKIVNEVLSYINKKSSISYIVSILSGVYFESYPGFDRFDLGQGVYLSNGSEFDLYSKEYIGSYSSDLFGGFLGFQVLVCENSYPIIYKKGTSPKFDRDTVTSELYRKLDDARLCMSLCKSKGLAIQSTARTIIQSSNPVILGNSVTISPYRNTKMQSPILEIELRLAKDIFQAFDGLDDELKNHYRISLRKFSQAASEMEREQASVDLRVALESFYEVDGEKRKTTSIRAALYSEESDKMIVKRNVGKFYDAASNAVHKGRFGKKDDLSTIDFTLEVLRKAHIKTILGGKKILWDQLELGFS